jgi:hypothetical protein
VEVTEGLVRASIDRGKASLEDAAREIVWQIKCRAWEVLGYPDWNTMREAEYGGAAFMVPRRERPELVAELRREGLTQQEIADTAGVTQQQVGRDLNTHMRNEDEPAPEVTNSRGQQRPASYAPRAKPQQDEDQDRGQSEVERAVEEFPDLAYYADLGRHRDVVNMAGDLRRFRDRGELDSRLDTLRKSIALDRSKRDGTYKPTPMRPHHCPTCTCEPVTP